VSAAGGPISAEERTELVRLGDAVIRNFLGA
jgi:hypothetical protein